MCKQDFFLLFLGFLGGWCIYMHNNVVQIIVDWLQSLKQFFINVSCHILVASLTLMALF